MPLPQAHWTATFTESHTLSELRSAVKAPGAENPCKHGLRSVCWKAFLVFENLDLSTWPKVLRDSRSAYVALKEHFLPSAQQVDRLAASDPLADDIGSPWNALRTDEVLRAEIQQDVDRCMPDNPYFRESKTQETLLNILFIFCKLNVDVGYRQGMHELLAPILWVVSQDAVESQSADLYDDSGKLLEALLAWDFVEHDAFTLFCIVMQTAKSFYENGANAQRSAVAASTNSPIVERSHRIHGTYLRQADPKLADHLHSIDILPQIFIIRWIRLLFGREFPFEDVLCLWDVLFAEDPCLNLVDFICVAMLLRIRWRLLAADYSSALAILLRYPTPESPHGPVTLVEDALFLRSNLSSETGARMITKYTGRAPHTRPTLRSRTPQSPTRAPNRGPRDPGSTSPLRLPGHLFQDSRIEELLQDAAKGVYKQTEKLGLNQAFRDAVQGFQSGATSPRQTPLNSRWSLDKGRTTGSQEDLLKRQLRAMNQRNADLGRLVQVAMEDLRTQIQELEYNDAKDAANSLSLVLAKLQYVQVYLENPSLPPDQSQAAPPTQDDLKPNGSSREPLKLPDGPRSEENRVIVRAESRSSPPAFPARRGSLPCSNEAGQASPSPTRRPRAKADHDPITGEGSPARASFHESRPSLAQSSFSWMLGSSPVNTHFRTSSPFSPEQERRAAARGKAGFLFGDKDDPSVGDANSRAPSEGAEAFTLNALKENKMSE